MDLTHWLALLTFFFQTSLTLFVSFQFVEQYQKHGLILPLRKILKGKYQLYVKTTLYHIYIKIWRDHQKIKTNLYEYVLQIHSCSHIQCNRFYKAQIPTLLLQWKRMDCHQLQRSDLSCKLNDVRNVACTWFPQGIEYLPQLTFHRICVFLNDILNYLGQQ